MKFGGDLVLDKAFFGKINCLKVQLSKTGDCYFHLGLLKDEKWAWKKIKMSSGELGDIVYLLRKDIGKCSFFHSFDGGKTQIWCNRSERGFSIKVADVSKNLTIGESEVLRILLERIVLLKEYQ